MLIQNYAQKGADREVRIKASSGMKLRSSSNLRASESSRAAEESKRNINSTIEVLPSTDKHYRRTKIPTKR